MLKINQDFSKINQFDFENSVNKLSIFPDKARIIVAVSGGADSLCLALLLNVFSKKINAELLAVIIDHKLRIESTDEAIFVSKLLNQHGIKSVILNRENIPIYTGIQSKARKDRYDLLKNYARDNKYPYIFVAHHLDDQLETISIRQESGINIIGDSGMSAKIVSKDSIILRPLLNYTKQQILNTMQNVTNVWVEDPSNQNTKYTRVQHRLKIKSLNSNEKKLLIDNYIKNVEKRHNIEKKLLKSFSESILINKLGLIKLNLILFNKYDENIKILLLRKLIKFANAKNYEVKIQQIKNFLSKLKESNSFKNSLGNCLLKVKKNEIIIFKNRISNIESLVNEIWDDRFIYLYKKAEDGFIIKKIKEEIYLKGMESKEFKEYFSKNYIDGDYIKGLPWIFNNKKQFNWDYKNYKYFKYKSKNSIFMNFF